jgi:hypothetical protein
MFRVEISLRGDTPYARRIAIAEVLRRMADNVALDCAPTEAGPPTKFVKDAELVGSFWFEPVQRDKAA